MADKPKHRATQTYIREKPLVAILSSGHNLNAEEIQCLVQAASERGWRLIDYTMIEATRPGEMTVAGAITYRLSIDPLMAKLRSLGCPMVRVGTMDHPDDASIPAILPDFIQIGRMAAEHFTERGFKNLALVGHERYQPLHRIQQGMLDGIKTPPCSCSILAYPNIERASVDLQRGKGQSERWKQVRRWLMGLPKPLGILAVGTWSAGNISILCREEGLKMPEEVALLATGNEAAFCELSLVPISAVNFPQEDRIKTAVHLLDEMMKGHMPPPRTYVKPREIVTRRSTDILAVNNARVAQAVRFIWDHLATDLSVDDVALAVQTPRHTLQRLFRKHLDRGVHQEMQRARLERLAHLLRSTDATVEQLAPQAGLHTAAYATLAFRKSYGQTPGEYRRQQLQGSSKA